MGVLFDADGEDYVATPGLGSQANFSVTAWVRLDTDRNTFQTVWSIDNGTADYCYLQTDSGGVQLGAFDDTLVGAVGARTLTLGTWYYWAVARNGTNFTVLSRAISDTSFTASTSSSGSGNTNSANFRIGESPFGGEWWSGAIGAVKWYSFSMTQSELEQDYWMQRPTRSMRAHYPLLRPETTDYSGNGFTLTGGSGATYEDGPPVPWMGPDLYDVNIGAGFLGPPEQTDSVGLTDTTAIQQSLERTDSTGATDTTSITQSLARTDNGGPTDSVSIQQSLSRTDNGGPTDSATVSLIKNLTFDDSTGLTDTSQQDAFPAGPNPTDSAGLTDSVSVSQQKNPTDDAGLDDDVFPVTTFGRVPTDSSGSTDSWTLAATYSRGVADDSGLTDVSNVSATFVRSATDDTGLTDSFGRSVQRTADDGLGLTDSVTRVLSKTVDDSAGLSDTGTTAAAYDRTVTDAVGLVDAAQPVATFNRVATDPAGLVESLGRELDKSREDFLPLADTSLLQTSFSRSATDTEGLTDSTVFAISWARSFQDNEGLTDTYVRELQRLRTDDVGLTDNAVVNLYRLEVISTDNVGLSDNFVTSKTRLQTKTDDTELADSVTVSLTAQRVITDSTGLVDAAVVSSTFPRTQTDASGLTDTTSVNLVKSLTITDGVGLTDVAQTPVVFSRTISDSTGIRDTGIISQVHGRTFNDVAGNIDSFGFTFGRTVADSVSLSDSVTQAQSLSRTFQDVAGLTDVPSRFASYSRNVTDNVGLVDPTKVRVPTQEEWTFEFNPARKSWSFSGATSAWWMGESNKSWRIFMIDDVVEVVAVNPEDIEVTVFGSDAGVPVDPTISDLVHFAFLGPYDAPNVGTSWVVGTWGVTPQEGNLPDLYKAFCTVTGIPIGRYSIWVRVTHGAKKPTQAVGTLIVK